MWVCCDDTDANTTAATTATINFATAQVRIFEE